MLWTHDRLVQSLAQVLGLEGFDDPEHRRTIRWGLALAGAAMALRTFFWIYTHRVWEDALITVLHSENFWRGLGMTHYLPGEPPLHGFTSPLSVLIPLVGDAFHIGFGIEFLKLVSVFAGGLAVLYVTAIAIHPRVRLPLPAAVLAMGYVTFEHHQILWGMAGMETQVVTAILLMSFYYLISQRPLGLGISLGLCMLARPDYAFWTVIAGMFVLISNRRQFPKVVLVAFVVYLPWIIFTSIYYGSPVPNTIHAKSFGYCLWWQAQGLSWTDWKREIYDRVTGTYFFNTIFQPLGPSFAGHGTHFRAIIGDHGAIANTMVALAGLGALAALFRRQRGLAAVGAFVGAYAIYYVFFVPWVFGWYLVPFVAATILLSARGLSAATSVLPNTGWRPMVMTLLVTAYLGLTCAVLPLTFRTEKQIQQVVEDNGRKQIGLYLASVMKPEQTIGCEPLGYIGYYSGRTVYDWPGLTNRKVVEFLKDHPDQRTLEGMLRHFAPDYVVLRQHEYSAMSDVGKEWLQRDYVLDREFKIAGEQRQRIFLIETNQDCCFRIFRKVAGKHRALPCSNRIP